MTYFRLNEFEQEVAQNSQIDRQKLRKQDNHLKSEQEVAQDARLFCVTEPLCSGR